MQYYKTHAGKLAGTHHERLMKKAFGQYKEIVRKSKRRPYIRSVYFDKQKIFLGIFWQHLHEKNLRDKAMRLALFPCAIELMQKTKKGLSTLWFINHCQKPFSNVIIPYVRILVKSDLWIMKKRPKLPARGGQAHIRAPLVEINCFYFLFFHLPAGR